MATELKNLSLIAARRAFSVVGLSVWNSLPDYLRDSGAGRNKFRQCLSVLRTSAYCTLQVLRLCAI